MKKTILGIIIGLIIGAGPAFATSQPHDMTIEKVGQGAAGHIKRWDDPQFQVKCWESENGYAGGMSCIPWSQIKARTDR